MISETPILNPSGGVLAVCTDPFKIKNFNFCLRNTVIGFYYAKNTVDISPNSSKRFFFVNRHRIFRTTYEIHS
jgi:hypothetical protein